MPSVAAFQTAVEQAFAAWESVDPATGLGTTLRFTADLGTAVVQETPDPSNLFDFVGLNRGAEIDIIAKKGETIAYRDVHLVLDGGGVRALDAEGNDLGGHQAFWFAWSQFHPETELWPL